MTNEQRNLRLSYAFSSRVLDLLEDGYHIYLEFRNEDFRMVKMRHHNGNDIIVKLNHHDGILSQRTNGKEVARYAVC